MSPACPRRGAAGSKARRGRRPQGASLWADRSRWRPRARWVYRIRESEPLLADRALARRGEEGAGRGSGFWVRPAHGARGAKGDRLCAIMPGHWVCSTGNRLRASLNCARPATEVACGSGRRCASRDPTKPHKPSTTHASCVRMLRRCTPNARPDARHQMPRADEDADVARPKQAPLNANPPEEGRS
jgi:hypothetical protein